jgi:hypothetical protein
MLSIRGELLHLRRVLGRSERRRYKHQYDAEN